MAYQIMHTIPQEYVYHDKHLLFTAALIEFINMTGHERYVTLQVLSRKWLCWHVRQSVQDTNSDFLHGGAGDALDHEAQL